MLSKIVDENIALDKDESKRLADAAVSVMECYDIPMMDEKTMAWANLGFVACEIYAPRIATAVMKSKKGLKMVKPFDRSNAAPIVDLPTAPITKLQ
jgi:hypothetical protein